MHPSLRLLLIVVVALTVWVIAEEIVGMPAADVLAWCVLAALAVAGAR